MAAKKKRERKKPKKTVKFGQGTVEVDDEPEVDIDEAVDIDEQQPALVPMSEQEVKDAGKKLAQKVRDLKDMTTQHQGQRAEMKAERTALRDEIDAIAQTIRQQGR